MLHKRKKFLNFASSTENKILLTTCREAATAAKRKVIFVIV